MVVIRHLLRLGVLVLLLGESAPTTDAPGVSTQAPTTEAPTTAAPGVSTQAPTTEAPTTAAPGVSTSAAPTAPPGVSTSAAPTAPPGVSTSAAPTAPPGVSTPAPTTAAPGPCASSPCPGGSTCQEILSNYKCLCRPGHYYDETQKLCNQARNFPSELRLTKITYNSEMSDKKSKIFQETADNILRALMVAFENDIKGYLGSTVLSLKKGSVVADVENFFSPSADISENAVKAAISKATEEKVGILSGAEVTYKDVCFSGVCEKTSTSCHPENGLATCTCKKGYIKLIVTEQTCLPCPSGQKAVGTDTCEPCSFGYSGFNCGESYLLILVVVSCVLGVLLLGTLIGTTVLYTRSKKMPKSSEKNALNGKQEFSNPAGIPRIPRANPNAGWQPTNLEMTDSGSRHALVTKDRTENTTMWDYDYTDDARSYKSQTPSRTGYGAAGANNVPRESTRNPYYDAYDDRMRRY